jgi:hypothetical protein
MNKKNVHNLSLLLIGTSKFWLSRGPHNSKSGPAFRGVLALMMFFPYVADWISRYYT